MGWTEGCPRTRFFRIILELFVSACYVHDMNSSHSNRFDTSWFVVMTRPRQERTAKEHLTTQGFEVYLPMAGGDDPVALFPRYLFLRPGYPDQSLETVRSTRGVSHLVKFSDQLAVASGQLIESVRWLEASFDRVAADQISAHDRVEILEGPFAGYDAEVAGTGTDRVIVLMRVLGSEKPVQLPMASVRKIS